jgi:formate-dependent nitrite reductase membrane component NrfD
MKGTTMGMREPLPPPARYEGPTYYGQPMLKASHYGALVWGYTWIAGLAGSAQVLATLADVLGRPDLRGMVRQGRRLAAFLPVVGAGLLVADLHTPQRFYNMLRIFRATSPMSIGSYVLSAFSLSSLVTAWAGATGRTRLARAAQVPAAAAGAGMSVYTGALLAATSTPAWSAQPRLLAGRFGASAFATGAAALSIGETLRGHDANAARLDRTAALAALLEYGLGKAAQQQLRRRGLAEADAAGRRRSEVALLAPLACLALNELAPRRSRALSVAGAAGLLAAGLVMRATVFREGNASARRPQDAFAAAGGIRDAAPAWQEPRVQERVQP